MKKKLLSMLLVITMSFSLVGCGEKEEPKNEEGQQVEVDENLLTVELTIPAEFVEQSTQEECDQIKSENGFKSVTLNEDGSVTYVMTKKQHKETMQEMAKSYRESMDEMIGSEEYPNFKKIEVNDSYTEFTVTTSSKELDFNESFSSLAFYMMGGLYNMFNNTPADSIIVNFVNADSGEIIHTFDSAEMAEE